jgi:hypothetical protein
VSWVAVVFAAACGALIGIFLVGVIKPAEPLAFHVPTTTEDAAATLPGRIGINNCYREIQVANLECRHIAIFYSLPSLGKLYVETKLAERPSHWFCFTYGEGNFSKVIMARGEQWAYCLTFYDIFQENPTFNDERRSIALVYEEEYNIISVYTYISYNKMWSVRGIKFGASYFGGLMRCLGETFCCFYRTQKISLLVGGDGAQPGSFLEQTASSNRQENRECGDHNSRDGADSSVVGIDELSEGERTRHIISGLMVIFGGVAAVAGAVATFIWSRPIKPRGDANKRY